METFKDCMVFTRGGEDEKDKINYYLKNEKERKEMSEKACKIAKSLQINNLLEIIGG